MPLFLIPVSAVRRMLLALCLVLLAILPLSAQQDALLAGLPPSVAERFRSIQSGNIRVLYHEVDQAMARHIVSAVDVSRMRLADELGMRELPRSTLVIAFDKEHFYRMSGGSAPHWAGAVTLSERRLVVFRSSRWGDVGEDLSATVRHELAHLGLGALHRGKWIPTWLEEGVAVEMSGLPRSLAPEGSAISLSKALSTGTLLGLEAIESLHGFAGDRVGLAYMESESAVRFFLERYGRVALVQILTQVGRGVPFHVAFDAATNGGWFRFEEEWRAWLDDQRGLYFLVDINSWLWILILLLGVAAFSVRWMRSRRILRRWKEEEAARISFDDDWQPPRP